MTNDCKAKRQERKLKRRVRHLQMKARKEQERRQRSEHGVNCLPSAQAQGSSNLTIPQGWNESYDLDLITKHDDLTLSQWLPDSAKLDEFSGTTGTVGPHLRYEMTATPMEDTFSNWGMR